ncbi:Uncharacterized protein GBIM_18688 [Gryllus bimaculatus]|nr:Uncharacterized protein GBIM_18688 [Gryllus bimaculatus]
MASVQTRPEQQLTPQQDQTQYMDDKLGRSLPTIADDEVQHPEIPRRGGKINGLEKFDASFFSVHFKQAHTLDPMCRLLLERSYEAIVDAGVNPRTLRGSRMGVFVGTCYSESEKFWFYEKLQLSGFGLTGCSRAMLANRISYWLGAKGASCTKDTACSSSMYAFYEAFEAIRNGHIDCALVGGTNLTLHPYMSLQFSRLGRAKDARRVYATVVNAAVNCDGFKEQGITYPSGQAQAELMRDTCRGAGVDPASVAYVEAHGTGTRVGDPEEVGSIDKVFCLESGRQTPLLIGSVKSNLGHTEPVSGLCSIAKVIVAMEDGVIPPSINFRRPRKTIQGLMEGRVKVVVVLISSVSAARTDAVVVAAFPHLHPLSPEPRRGDSGTCSPLPRLVLAFCGVTLRGSCGSALDVGVARPHRFAAPAGCVSSLHRLH